MDGRPVELRIAGQTYRVRSSASEAELLRLAEAVSAKVEELTPEGRPVTSTGIVLAALALARDVEQERARRIAVERRARDMLGRVLVGLDDALGPAPARP